MRRSGRLGGPMIGISSFFLPWNRGEAATARLTAPPVSSSSRRAEAVSTRSSHAPTTIAPDRGTAGPAKLIFIELPRDIRDSVCGRDRRSAAASQCRRAPLEHPKQCPIGLNRGWPPYFLPRPPSTGGERGVKGVPAREFSALSDRATRAPCLSPPGPHPPFSPGRHHPHPNPPPSRGRALAGGDLRD